MLIAQWREANERPEAFVDHQGVMRDARTGKAITQEEVEGTGGEDDDMRRCLYAVKEYISTVLRSRRLRILRCRRPRGHDTSSEAEGANRYVRL